jgi:hypothetical protein
VTENLGTDNSDIPTNERQTDRINARTTLSMSVEQAIINPYKI